LINLLSLDLLFQIIHLNNKAILLTHRLQNDNKDHSHTLELTAQERKKLRGRRMTLCGVELLLQLPREGPLIPGDLLLGENTSYRVLITAAIEDLLEVSASSTLQLMQASYHLGNRHVDLEVQETNLFLESDPVLKKMLLERGLFVKSIRKAFFPEGGAYAHAHSN